MEECLIHNRAAYLWGGDVCDLCDVDNDGAVDSQEFVGIGPARTSALFGMEEKGWRLLSGTCLKRVLRGATDHIRLGGTLWMRPRNA